MLVLIALQRACAQSHAQPLPKFEDYPVNAVFTGTPHPTILVTREQRLFRTRIRDGVEKGLGVWVNGEYNREQNEPGPNFAGHYIIIAWGCGSDCISMAMSDAKTGAIYTLPLSRGQFGLPLLWLRNVLAGPAETKYRKDSRLLIIRATTAAGSSSNVAPFAFYFLWQADHWALLRREPIGD
jgi:hypothetical protein